MRYIFFDESCPLCQAFISFVCKRAPSLQAEALQGELAKKLLKKEDLNLKYLVFYEPNSCLKGDQAIKKIFSLIYPRFSILIKLVPSAWLYQLVARYRYRFFKTK